MNEVILSSLEILFPVYYRISHRYISSIVVMWCSEIWPQLKFYNLHPVRVSFNSIGASCNTVGAHCNSATHRYTK